MNIYRCVVSWALVGKPPEGRIKEAMGEGSLHPDCGNDDRVVHICQNLWNYTINVSSLYL